MDLSFESHAAPLSSPALFAVLDSVLDEHDCEALIRRVENQSWLSTTWDGSGDALPRRVSDPDLPCRFVDDDVRPPFASVVDPVLALRLFYRLEAILPETIGEAQLSGLKPLMRCVHLSAGEATTTHREPLRACPDGQISALSFILFLNDAFEGGSVEFPGVSRSVDPRAGRVVVFANDLLHTDALVTAGDRFTLEGEVFYTQRWRPYR
ncbi:WD40 repeat protein [Plesiocystis pacifica SIR-1]|uniref:WD40 repeat protein n=2 Tax=Plesiocystis pacifica TaxID=191768 RepID=A6G5D7_9BACT|nr:WD40 repeat protein [Plesiocystis pacifica SIR-1]